jgi:hypothetical protein
MCRYAENIMRKLEANINSSKSDFARKSSAFFKYAAYDDHMVCYTGTYQGRSLRTQRECYNHEHCKDAISDMVTEDDDVRYVAQYLGREYYVF